MTLKIYFPLFLFFIFFPLFPSLSFFLDFFFLSSQFPQAFICYPILSLPFTEARGLARGYWDGTTRTKAARVGRRQKRPWPSNDFSCVVCFIIHPSIKSSLHPITTPSEPSSNRNEERE
jgi:hypothetical protein